MRKYRKQFAFDLQTDRNTPLLKYYNSRSEPYDDIFIYMTTHGFLHNQGSVYTSEKRMTDKDVRRFITAMCKELPWLGECSKAFVVTDIGRQHNLLPSIVEACDELEEERVRWREHVNAERKAKAHAEKQSRQPDIEKQLAQAKAEAERYNATRTKQKGKNGPDIPER